MAHSEARAWWADVQHLRDDYERTDEARRRADQADLAERRQPRDRPPAGGEGLLATAPPARIDADLGRRRGDHPGALQAAANRRQSAAGSSRPDRRTIEIRGRTVPAPSVPPRVVALDRRRPPRRAVERVGPHPDRMALWALLMGLLLILVAIST